jgi:hypothetical protein
VGTVVAGAGAIVASSIARVTSHGIRRGKWKKGGRAKGSEGSFQVDGHPNGSLQVL